MSATTVRAATARWAVPATLASGLTALLPADVRPDPVLWTAGTALLVGASVLVVGRRAAVVGLVALAAALGMLVQLRLGVGPLRLAVLGVASCALLVAGARAGASSRTARVLAASTTRRIAALVALGSGVLLRASTVLGPAPASGTLPLVGVQIGELTRYLLAGGAALMLAERGGPSRWYAVDRRVRLAALLLAVAGLVTLALLGDGGPAVLLVLAVLAAAVHQHGLRARWALALAAGAVAVAPLAWAGSVLRARLGEVTAPGPQLTGALTAAWSGGLLGPGPGRSPLVQGVPAIGSDYAQAALVADLGVLVALPVVVGLLAALAFLVRRAATTAGPPGTLAVALAVPLFAQAAWNALGALGIVPLTGLNLPFVGVSGASLLTSSLVVGAVLGLLENERDGRIARGGAVITVATTTALRAATVLLVAAAVLLTVAPRPLGDAEQLRMPRGPVLTADGALVSVDLAGERVYPAGARYADLGFERRNATHRGLDAVEADTLTCGGRLSPLDVAASLLHPVCRPAGVVVTVDSRAQTAVADALAGTDAEAVVLDAASGAVRALAGTATTAPGAPSAARERQGPPGSTMKMITAAAALLAGVDFASAPAVAFRDDSGHLLGNAGGATCPATDVATALAHSCNSVFGWAATRVGAVELDRVARTYFGADGPVHLDGLDAPGLATAATSGADDGSLARTGIGQESVRSSVLGVAVATAAVADAGRGGTPWPHVVAGSCTGDVIEPVAPGPPIGPPLPASVGAVIRDGMHDALDGGTARRLVVPPHRDVAAKTGTAQVPGGIDSWVTTIVDGRYVLTLVVHHAAEGSAVDVATRILSGLPRSYTAPACPAELASVPQETVR